MWTLASFDTDAVIRVLFRVGMRAICTGQAMKIVPFIQNLGYMQIIVLVEFPECTLATAFYLAIDLSTAGSHCKLSIARRLLGLLLPCCGFS